MRLLLTLWILLLIPCAHAQLRTELVIADMEGDFGGLQGVSKNTAVVHGGGASALWADHPRNPNASFSGIPGDWSGFDNLELWLHSEVDNRAQFMLIISSENPDTDGIDYWSRQVTVDWTGWRLVRIPIKTLGGGARSPLGWDKIDRFYFTASGWNCEPKPDTVIRIDDVRLTNDQCRARLVDVKASRDGRTLAGVHEISVTNRLDTPASIAPAVEADEGVSVSVAPENLDLEPGKSATVTVTITTSLPGDNTVASLSDRQAVVRFPAAGEPADGAVSLSLPLASVYFASMAAPEHPRVLLNPELLADLRRRSKEEKTSRDTAQSIIRSAEGIIKRYAEGFPEAELASIERGRDLTARAEAMAMAYLLTEDEKYAHWTAKLITAADSWSTWVYEFHKGMVADLGTAGALRHFGISYDWAYQGMTDDERTACRKTIKTGLNMWSKGIETRVWWSQSFRNNWCAVCCGGGGLAAMALLGEDPEAATMIAEAYPRIVKFLDEGGVDGGWPEGTGYWGYGVSHAALFADGLKIISGGEVDLFAHPYFQTTWQFPLYMHCPPSGTINFADCGYGWPNAELTLEIGKELKNPYAVWYYRQRPRSNTQTLLWDREELEAREPVDLPQSIHFRGIDWAALRSGWDNDATIFGIRGGNNGENHGMLECGNFVINSMGERLITDYGAMTYTHEYFSGERWDFYRANTHGSNCVLVDDMDQLPGRDATGKITNFFTTEAFDYLRLDATKAYPDFVKLMERRVLFVKPDTFVMLDTVKTDGERSFEWRCHPATQGDVEIGEGTMAVENGRASLAARWLLPESAAVTDGQGEGEDYHVSVVPEGKSDEMRFLTVMRCGDQQGAALFEMTPDKAAAQVSQMPRVLLIMSSESNEWRFIRKLVYSQGFEVDWIGEDKLASLPIDWHRLADYAAVFLVPPKSGAEALSPGQQSALAEYVKQGGGLVMVGGTASFGAGGFADSELAEILPVQIVRPDDNVTHIKQKPFVSDPAHPLLAGLPEEWPAFGSDFGGYHDVRLKEGATQVLGVDKTVTDEDIPFCAAGTAGRGRTMTFGALWAFSTGQEFKTWEHAGRFFGNAVEWLSGGIARADADRAGKRASLDSDAFPLGESSVVLEQSENQVGFQIGPGRGGILLRTGQGLIGGDEMLTDGEAIIAWQDEENGRFVMGAVGATLLRTTRGEGIMESSRPVCLALSPDNGELGRAKARVTVDCTEATDIKFRFGTNARVVVDDREMNTGDDEWLAVSLEAGRHVFVVG